MIKLIAALVAALLVTVTVSSALAQALTYACTDAHGDVLTVVADIERQTVTLSAPDGTAIARTPEISESYIVWGVGKDFDTLETRRIDRRNGRLQNATGVTSAGLEWRDASISCVLK